MYFDWGYVLFLWSIKGIFLDKARTFEKIINWRIDYSRKLFFNKKNTRLWNNYRNIYWTINVDDRSKHVVLIIGNNNISKHYDCVLRN